MTLDLKLEDKIDRLSNKENIVLNLNYRIKERGNTDPSSIDQFQYILSNKLLELPDELYGTFLSVRGCIDYAIENVINQVEMKLN
ncbi:MAG: hypothetical protein DRP16_00900 [Candidatus Aenigmatarchaeota archaeon]|nr:MAG: hypothetical protein DRP16_00900 [Candidatus Aenigmarchaeota archaeon]